MPRSVPNDASSERVPMLTQLRAAGPERLVAVNHKWGRGRRIMRSAIYYPRTQVHSKAIMKSSLLLWDRLHTIVPMQHYEPDYYDRADMAEAWELIGSPIVPMKDQKERAHEAIEATLRAGT